jgi:hypothetical protein
MYLHLGQDTVICSENIVAMFDIDACTVSKKTRDFLTSAEKQGNVINVSFELPKSFIVCENKGEQKVYISQISTKTLQRRLQITGMLFEK